MNMQKGLKSFVDARLAGLEGLRILRFPRLFRESRVPSSAQGLLKGPLPAPESPYSDQYETIIRQGHTRPIPEFGAPTLVWHVGIWPRRYVKGTREACDPHDTFNRKYADARLQHESRRTLWVDQVNAFVRMLQEAGCLPDRNGQRVPLREFVSYIPHELQTPRNPAGRAPVDGGTNGGDGDAGDEPAAVLQNETIGFTIWWPDGRDGNNIDAAIRVRVQVELNADYAAFSFYMDLGQPWDKSRLRLGGGGVPGQRRSAAFKAVADVKLICEQQLKPVKGAIAPVDRPLLPEQLASPDRRTPVDLDEALMDARNLLYVSLWEDFCAHFGCSLDQIAGPRGEVFANFRGLVIPTEGAAAGGHAGTPWADHAADGLMGSLGTQDFPRFDPATAEPNAVLKAYWPFVRRITIDADYRDVVACGVMGFRALYVTALGASSQYSENAERRPGVSDRKEDDVINHVRPDDGALYRDTQIRERVGRKGNNHPVRYLFLTKCEPHPLQIGRIVERINTMGTLRLFALKDWSAIRDADPSIRMLGQELDQKIRIWSRKRKTIHGWTSIRDILDAQQAERRKWENQKEDNEDDFSELLRVDVRQGEFRIFLKRVVGRLMAVFVRRYVAIIRREEHDRIEDVKFSALYEVTKRIESSLIDIGTRLDDVGAWCVGGLHFRLYRSSLYVKEFVMLLETLRVDSVPTWASYDRFVERGLKPAFEYVEDVGVRLRALRNRLQSVMDGIETSALVVQSEATRHNTAVLRHIMIVSRLLVLVVAAGMATWSNETFHWLDSLRGAWSWLNAHLPVMPWISAHIEDLPWLSAMLERIRQVLGL